MSTPPHRLAARPETADDPLVTQFMSTRLVAIVPDASLVIALRLMAVQGVRHLPVLDGSRCVGLVLETDVVRGIATGPDTPGRPPLLVGAQCRPVPTLRPHDRRSAAARRMYATGSDAVLVTDGDELLGIVTATDLIRSLAGDAPLAPSGDAP
jgi:FOG: CBS domain